MKYAIHPGYVTSFRDGDRHYLSASRLAELYGLSKDRYIIWDRSRPETYRGRDWDDFKHLFPRPDGRYFYICGDKV